MSNQQHMIEQARGAMTNAYAPYSNFHVGACFAAEDGSFYTGCNIENASFGCTLCAEASALSALIGAGRQRITEVAVTSSGEEPVTPCGICLQRISEFATPDTPIHVSGHNGQVTSMTLVELFPQSFNKHHMRGTT